MSEELVPTATVPHPPDRTLVALTPSDVGHAQTELLAWCDQKIAALNAERSDLIDSARIAASNNWASASLDRLATKKAKEVEYYRKIRAAVAAGYLIVPNFDIEIMAVRVDGQPEKRRATFERVDITHAAAGMLPVGEGRYVDEKLQYRELSYSAPDPRNPGQTKHHELYEVSRYDDNVDFPVLAVKPLILEATARAMALKIFDRIGVVTGKREDPIVVGQVLHPSVGKKGQHFRGFKRVSFFIAWWLSTETL